MRSIIVLLILIFCSLQFSSAQTTRKEQWVDSVFRHLTTDEKIAQMLMVPVASDWEKNRLNELEKVIKQQGIGALWFFRGSPIRQISITDNFRSQTRVPILVSMDGTSGLGPLLDSTMVFPNSLSIAASNSDSLTYVYGKEIGRQLKLLGVNMHMGLNASIADTSVQDYKGDFLGGDKMTVAKKAMALQQGFAAEGILACARKFSIQGATVIGIEHNLPVVKTFGDTSQMYPFKKLFENRIAAVMPESRELPLFYETKSSARKNKLSGIMISSFFARQRIQEQRYNGLIIIDARPIEKSIRKVNRGDVELMAVRTGNDLVVTDYPEATIRKIKKYLRKNKDFHAQLDIAVRKILGVKYDAGLSTAKKMSSENIVRKLNSDDAKVLQQRLFKAAVTVVKNEGNLIPVRSLENRKTASVVVGDTSRFNAFHHGISKYAENTMLSIRKQDDINRLPGLLAQHQLTIVAFTSTADRDIVTRTVQELRNRPVGTELIVADFGNPYFPAFANEFGAVITSYADVPTMLRSVPQVIYGGTHASGTLPIPMRGIASGTGTRTNSLNRFEYSIPEDAAMSSKTLNKIQSIAEEAIENQATPGCHVLVARHGKVIYEKSFGYLTYEKQFPVTDSTLFDLASVTKVSATLQAVMFLYDRGMIDINKKASVYLPELKNSNKKDFTIKDILTHQAGLWPFLPFWAQTMKDSVHLPEYYQPRPSLEYPFIVAEKLYANVSMKDSLWNWIIKAKIREKPARTPYDYRYSDMGFYILHHLAEKLLNQPMEDFLAQNLYEPLGAYTTGYLPLINFRATRIAPTENDRLFRKSLLIGTVHDQGAAMHGGIAGHAGLFSTANDLAKLGQMLLQDGHYGGYQYYRPETIRLFAKKQFETSPRGLGWHKPVQSDWNSPTSIYASPRTFGHTGFTGTCIWVDPEFDLVYVFLSNRVHPDMTNNKLLTSNIRSRIQDVIYESIFDFCKIGKGSLPQPPLEASTSSYNK